MKNPVGRALWSIALALVSVGVLFSQDLVGTWQGALKNPKGKELRLVAKIARDAKEKLNATFYSIDQGGQAIPAGAVTFQGGNLKIEIPAIGGSYEGKLSADANTLTGTWTQGQPAPMNLVRATAETAWAIPEPPPPPKIMPVDADPSFEVATIKPSDPNRPGNSILVNREGMLNTTNTPLRELMIFSYGVHPDQIQGLPEWAATERYDVSGKPDIEGVGNDVQIRSMMKKLLAERFQLKFHTEKKEITAYTLNVRGEHKMQLNESGGNLPGFRGGGPGAIGVNNSTMAQFAGFLQARIVDRPVVDKTGLTGKFNFQLSWRPDNLPAQGPNGQPLPADIQDRPDIYTAMQEQLGLRFQSEKTAVDIFVIDKVEKPSEN